MKEIDHSWQENPDLVGGPLDLEWVQEDPPHPVGFPGGHLEAHHQRGWGAWEPTCIAANHCFAGGLRWTLICPFPDSSSMPSISHEWTEALDWTSLGNHSRSQWACPLVGPSGKL